MLRFAISCAVHIIRDLVPVSTEIVSRAFNTTVCNVTTLEHSHISRQWCTAAVQVIPAQHRCVQTEFHITDLLRHRHLAFNAFLTRTSPNRNIAGHRLIFF